MAHILVMGVCGVGKSTVAKALAESLAYPFLDADNHHSPENIASMAAGRPLTDAMRHGWLDRVARAALDLGSDSVIACSALKQSYRDRLSSRLDQMLIIFLTGDRDLLARRMTDRKDHFMPVSLLDSQFADLEPPDGTSVCRINVASDQKTVVAEATSFIRASIPEARKNLSSQI